MHTGIKLSTTTTENNHLHLQCNGSGLHQDTKLRLYYGPKEEERECIRLNESTGPHVVCQHTIINPNKTHSGHYYCQVDPSTCDALRSENVHVHVQTSTTNVSTNKITADDANNNNSASTTDTQYTIIIIAVAGMALTSLAVVASFIMVLSCCLYSRLANKPAVRDEENEQLQPNVQGT